MSAGMLAIVVLLAGCWVSLLLIGYLLAGIRERVRAIDRDQMRRHP